MRFLARRRIRLEDVNQHCSEGILSSPSVWLSGGRVGKTRERAELRKSRCLPSGGRSPARPLEPVLGRVYGCSFWLIRSKTTLHEPLIGFLHTVRPSFYCPDCIWRILIQRITNITKGNVPFSNG